MIMIAVEGGAMMMVCRVGSSRGTTDEEQQEGLLMVDAGRRDARATTEEACTYTEDLDDLRKFYGGWYY